MSDDTPKGIYKCLPNGDGSWSLYYYYDPTAIPQYPLAVPMLLGKFDDLIGAEQFVDNLKRKPVIMNVNS